MTETKTYITYEKAPSGPIPDEIKNLWIGTLLLVDTPEDGSDAKQRLEEERSFLPDELKAFEATYPVLIINALAALETRHGSTPQNEEGATAREIWEAYLKEKLGYSEWQFQTHHLWFKSDDEGLQKIEED